MPKKVKSNVTVLPFLIIWVSSIAAFSQDFDCKVEKESRSNNFKMSVTNRNLSNIVFVIKDKEGQAFFRESIRNVEKLKKVFFLGSLSPGDYVVEVNNDTETYSSKITITENDNNINRTAGKSLLVGFSKGTTAREFNLIIQNQLSEDLSLQVLNKNKKIMDLKLQKELLSKRKVTIPENETGEFVIKVGSADNVFAYKISL